MEVLFIGLFQCRGIVGLECGRRPSQPEVDWMSNDGSITIQNNAPENGLAVLLEAYLCWILSRPGKGEKDLSGLCLKVGIDITDSDMGVSVRFAGDTVYITGEVDEDVDVTIRTTAARALSFSGVVFSGDIIAYLTEGRRNALNALASGELDITGLMTHLPRVIRLLKAIAVS